MSSIQNQYHHYLAQFKQFDGLKATVVNHNKLVDLLAEVTSNTVGWFRKDEGDYVKIYQNNLEGNKKPILLITIGRHMNNLVVNTTVLNELACTA